MPFPPDEVRFPKTIPKCWYSTFAQAKIISIFIQTLLYGERFHAIGIWIKLIIYMIGAYTVLFALTSWVLVSRRPRGQPVHKVMFGTSLILFTLATMVRGIRTEVS